MIEPAIGLFNDEATKYAMVPMGRAGTTRGDRLRDPLPRLRRGELLHRHGAAGRRRLHLEVLPGGMNSVPIDQLKVGEAVESRKTISKSDVYLFAGVTGDFNPVHVDAEFAKGTMFGARIAHGPLTFSLCAGLLGTELPGLGTIAISNYVRYQRPVYFGDTIAVRVEVGELDTSATGRRCRSPGATRTASRSPRAQMVVAPPSEPVSL